MKKTRSKKKIATNSKRRQMNKVPSKNARCKATKLCSCVGHQLSSDSSSDDLAAEDQSHSAIEIQLPVPAYMKHWTSEDELATTEVPAISDESHQVNLKNSKTLLDEGGIPHSENTASVTRVTEPNAQTNRRPPKTRSSELIRLFYTIVADESFFSEPSDSEDSVTPDVHHEIEVEVHHDKTTEEGIDENPKSNLHAASTVSLQDQAVTGNVDTASESSSHSDINIQNANRDDSDKGTWFATGHRYEFSSSTVVSQDEEVSSLTDFTEEIGYCELSPPAADDNAEVTIGIGYRACTQQLYNEVQLEEYTNYDYQEEQNNVFQNEASLYVIEEVPEDDCDVTSNISVETVKDMNSPCNFIVGVGDTNLDGLETQLDMSLVDSTGIPDPTPSEDVIETCEEAIVAEDSTEIYEGSTIDNPIDQILISDEQTRTVRLLNNTTSNPQEGSMVFSQDQAVTEIIATGSRMVDEVKELISELLDVCMQSRGNDVAPVAGHGDFAEASTFSPVATLAENNDFIETQNDDLGNNIAGVPANFPLLTQTDYTEAHAEDPGDHAAHGANRTEVFELAGTDLSTSDGLDVHVDQCEHHDQPLPLEAHVNGTLSSSSNTHCAEAGSSTCSYESQQERQSERTIMHTQSNPAIKSTDNDDDNNPTELRTSQNQHETADRPPIIIAENASHKFGGMLRCTDEVWPVKKIEGYDLAAAVNPIQEISNDKFYQESTEILKIIGVDIEQESITEEALLKNIASEEEDAQGDVPTLVGNQKVKIVGIDVDSSSVRVDGMNNCTSEKGSVGKVGQPLVENQMLKIVVVDVEIPNVHVDEMGMHDIKIIGIDLETQLSASVASDSSSNNVQVDEEGDSTRMNDMSPCVSDVGNIALESEVRTEPLLMEDQCEDIRNTSKDVARCDGDAILASDRSVCDETISKESGENRITEAARPGADTCDSQSGYKCVADVASDEATGYDETQIDTHLPTFPRRARNQENDSLSDCGSLINDGRNGSAGSPCLSHSSFETVGHEYLQEVMEDGFVMVLHSPTIIVPPPQEEFNEEFMPPEFEVDDIIVNIATVSAMGDVAPAPRRSGFSPIAPSPDHVQFGDVNSRSPSPLPRTDLDVLDCLFDICENRLQRFRFKIPPLGTETYVNPKSKPLGLSPDCLDEQGDSIQSLENQKPFAMCDDLLDAMSGDDLGFLCCDPASSESYCSLPSTDAVPERPMMTDEEHSPERFFSFDTFCEVIETEQETLTLQIETKPGTGFQLNLDDQVLFCDSVHPNREPDVSHQQVDDTFISHVTKDPPSDNRDQSENTFGTMDPPLSWGKQEETDQNFVFFLALVTLSLFVYCKYGTCVLKAVMHWIWICQLIIQLFSDF